MGDDIIGRHTEVEVVAGFLAEVATGPAALLLSGAPGIGKTTVWQVAVDRARAAGFTVLSARPVEADASVAFGALADLLEPKIDQALPTLPRPQRHALGVAVLLEDPGPRPVDQRAVSAATSAVLRWLCARGPVVVAVDDAQWLDRPSAQALEVAMRRLSDTPIRLIAAERVDPRARPTLNFETTLPPHRTTRIDLAPMSLAALHDLLKDRVGRAFTRRMLLRIGEVTGGNPLFALEIARSLPDDAVASVAALPMPKQLLDLIETRVRALPVRTRSLLLTVASLRAPTLEAVRAATGYDEVEWRHAIEDAETHGLLEVDRSRLGFSHPLFAAAVYASASPGDRRRVHRTLATLIADLEEQARHRALGAELPDADLAAALDLAAEHARARGAPGSGAELAEWARDLTPENRASDQQRRTVRVAEYRFHAGEVSAARRLLEAVLGQAPEGAIQADVLRLLGEIRYHQDSFPDAIRLFEEALLHVGDEPRIAAGVELRLALCLRCLGRFEDAEVHTRRALDLTERIGDPALEAEALAIMARLDVLLGRGLDEMKLRRALELEDPHRQVAMQFRPSKIAGDLYLYVGQLDRSVQILERERERVLERGEESDLPFVLSHLTWAECWRGHLSVAAAHAAESLEIARQLGGPSVQSMALAFAAVVAAYQGQADNAERWAGEGLALGAESGWHTAIVWSSWALGALAVSRDDPRAAHAVLGELAKEVKGAGLTDPVRAVFLAEEIEALVGLGHLEEAAQLVDLLEVAGERLARSWTLVQAGRCRALLLAAGGDLEGAAGAADSALEVGESVEHRLEVARTMLVAGQLQRRLRRKAAARNLVEHATEIFEECGARIWARRAREELEHAGAHRAGTDLTTAERRVAGLVATGLTNREVATRLFMSPKTVETHLASTYRKLGIRSRAQLGEQIRVRQSDEN